MDSDGRRQFFAGSVFDGRRWLRDVRWRLDDDGRIDHLQAGTRARPGDERLDGVVIPGMPNLHSHAFQRAMAGLAEHRTHVDDSFWTWRETMYGMAGRMSPEQLEAVAAQLYLEMLGAGYTHVCEFHYLHGRPDGGAYDDPLEMSRRLLAAARTVGIGITLMPVLYRFGGFDRRPLQGHQRRFGLDPDQYLTALSSLDRFLAEDPTQNVGMAIHSLRAVPVEDLPSLLEQAPPGLPVHIHIAEQVAEVEECLDRHGARPVALLMDRVAVDPRWCLVHATHLDPGERSALARSGAVAGLCPTTEANLGDGMFELEAYAAEDGRFGIGSDSHISVSPVEELRWLEYGRRWIARRRNRYCSDQRPACGTALWQSAAAGGSRASGCPLGTLEVGRRGDWLTLDPDHPLLVGREEDRLLDSLVFSGNGNPIRGVHVAGRPMIEEGRHGLGSRVEERFRQVMGSLVED